MDKMLKKAEFGYHVKCPYCNNDDQQQVCGICRSENPFQEILCSTIRKPSINDQKCDRQKALDKMIAMRSDQREIVKEFSEDYNFIHNVIHCLSCNKTYNFSNLVSKIAYTQKRGDFKL